MTPVELRAETERLTALDDAGREKELVYLALRLGSDSDKAAKELHDLDNRTLKALAGDGAGLANEITPTDLERLDPRL